MIARQRKRRYQRKIIYEKKQAQEESKINISEKQRWNNRKDTINLKRRQCYAKNPSPTRQKVRQAYSNNPSPVCHRMKTRYDQNPSPVRHRVKEAYRENPSPVRHRVKEAYRENPSPVRHRVKEAYRENPSPVRHRMKEAYSENPFPVRHRVRHAYNQHASPVKKRVREAYHSNPSPARKRARLAYAENSSPIKKRVLGKYHEHPSPLKKKVLQRYHEHPSPLKKRAFQKYHENPSPFKDHSKKSYHSNVAASRSLRRHQYAKNPLPACTRSSIYYKNHQHDILERALFRRSTTLAALSVCNKYNRMFRRSFGRFSTFTDIVNKLTSNIEVRKRAISEFKVQLLVRSCLQQLSLCKHKFIKSFEKLQNVIKASISKANEVAITDLEVLDVLCGASLHTSNTELYNTAICYNPEAFNEDGILDLQKFPTCQTNYTADRCVATWECCLDPPLCKLNSESILTRLNAIYSKILNCTANTTRQYVEHIDDCTNVSIKDTSLQGHPLECYLSSPPCTSDLLYLRTLAPHFPAIRHIVSIIYEVRRNNVRITEIQKALQYGHLDKVLDVVQEARAARMRQYDVSAEVLNEKDILESYEEAFSKFNVRCLDVPKYPCVSCDKLCFQRECSQINRLHTVPQNTYWDTLFEFIETRPSFDDDLPTGYICHYCLQYFRSDKLPPRCILNGLDCGAVPEEIKVLNTYEKILIQRAKSFQTVSRMGTVAKKHLPSTHKVQKVRGTTFHLPLPLQETLKKLPPPHQALADTSELYILLRSIPSKTNVIWQDLVDVHKVYSALQKLKEINHLYYAIIIPGEPEELQLEGQIEEYSATSADAMVQQIAENEEAVMYEQYTINALHEPRQNERATALYQLIKVNEAPLDSRTKQLDMLCFPDLYPQGVGGQKCDREVQLQPAEYVKCILMSRDSRFRLNQQFIFYLLHQATMRQIASGIYHKLKVTRPKEKLTAAQCLELLSKDELEGNLTTIFSRLRNTEQYWVRPRNDLNCMTFHYGPATWFITLSPGEWLWEDLGTYLRKLNPTMRDFNISALVAADPVSTSRFIDNKFKAMLDFLLSDRGPLGNVIHYCARREYQGRGLQHFHLQLWIKDAPLIDERTDQDDINNKAQEDKVSAFIAKYATCQIPDPTLCPTLHERVMKFQQHKCNSYCLRSKKTKTGFRKVCRFGYPRPQCEKMCLRSVVEAVAGRKCLKANSRLYDLPRKSNEVRINDYNPAILLAWQGNMDIQYISEKSSILNWYCTKYSTKAEKSHSVQVFDDITSTKSLASRLWNVALRSLSHRECGALEAADTLLGIPLFSTDPNTTIRWVDVNMVRSRKLKDKSTIEALDGESCDIFFPSWVDSYYPNRPEELEDMHLYEFVAWHDWAKEQPSKNFTYYPLMGGFLKKRQRPYLINHYKYSVTEEPDKYYHTLLLLFKPWREWENLVGVGETYAEAFNAFKDESVDAQSYHTRLQQHQDKDKTVRMQVDKLRTEMEAEEQSTNEDSHKGDPLPYRISEAHEAMADFEAALVDHDDADVDAMMANLNEDQLRIFNKVRSHIQVQCTSPLTESTKPLRMFVSGCGGTGKSYLIKTIKAWVCSATDKHVAITAPTGIAAFNINGLTIHRLLQLPVEHGKTPQYRPLSDESLKIVRQRLHNLILLIIDEISMVSHITLLYIHLRLSEIFQTQDAEDGWFGSKNILVLGDLLQLPPVFESPVYTPLTSSIVHKHTGSVGCADIWRQLFSYDELTINMRQKEDSEFTELLGRIRLGVVLPADIKLLSNCKVALNSDTVNGRMKEIVVKLAELPDDTVCLLPTRHMCEQINAEVLKGLPGEQYTLVAEDSVDCSAAYLQKVKLKLAKYSEDSTHTAGLENVITVKVGCKVMLRRNIDLTLGLVNGAIGTVHSVQRCIDHANKVNTITIIFSNNQEYCLKRVNSKFEVFDKAYVIRSQFPITTAYAITIHKSQGLTLNHVLTDIGNSIFTCGQAYVALSRVKSIEGLHIINFDPRSIKALDSAILEYNRLREEFRPDLQSFTVPKRRFRGVTDQQWCTIKAVSTVQEPIHNSVQDITFKVKGFVNSDGVSSYANAVMQCLLLSPVMRQAMQQSTSTALKDICAAYTLTGDHNMDCQQLRQEIGSPYNGPHAQNAIVFLHALLNHSSQLSSALQHSVRLHIQCTHCNSSNFTDSQQHIISLSIPTSVKSLKMTELIQNYLSCTRFVDQLCNNCGHPVKMQKEIINPKHLLVLQLDVWNTVNGTVIKRKTNITSIPDSSITIGCSMYKPMSAVSLIPSTRPNCHYMAILSTKGKWTHMKDLTSSIAPWPRGGKDVILLFYHIKSTVTSTTALAKDTSIAETGHCTTVPTRTVFARTRTNKTTTTVPLTTSVISITTQTTAIKPTPATACTRTNVIQTTIGTTPTTNITATGDRSTVAAGSATTTTATTTAGDATPLTFSNCKGFSNNDGVSCYANSILQCLLQHTSVRNACLHSRHHSLRDLVYNYVKPTKFGLLSSRPVRRLIGAPFSVNRQQDASEFLQALAMFCEPLRNCLQYTIRTNLRCTSCTYTSNRDDNNTILPLVIPPDCSSVTLYELLAKLHNWETMLGSHCSTCNADGAVYQTRQELITASELIVVQLKVYVFGEDGMPHKLHISINDATSSAITVQGQSYKVHNIVSHHGPSVLSGHYTSYHKQSRGWMLVNDDHLTRVLQPDTNSNVYILFFAKQQS